VRALRAFYGQHRPATDVQAHLILVAISAMDSSKVPGIAISTVKQRAWRSCWATSNEPRRLKKSVCGNLISLTGRPIPNDSSAYVVVIPLATR
jgi:hypothetical protein